MGQNGVDCRQATKDNPQRGNPSTRFSGGVRMSRLNSLVSTVALGAAAFAVTFGVDSVDIRAQIANNPTR